MEEFYKVLALLYIFFGDPRVSAIVGLIFLVWMLAMARAIKEGIFQWRRLAEFMQTMVLPYVVAFLGVYLAAKLIQPDILGPYGMIVGEAVIWMAWLTLVFNLVADVYKKLKDLGIPLPELPGFPPEPEPPE